MVPQPLQRGVFVRTPLQPAHQKFPEKPSAVVIAGQEGSASVGLPEPSEFVPLPIFIRVGDELVALVR
jgi:hypothetical protein